MFFERIFNSKLKQNSLSLTAAPIVLTSGRFETNSTIFEITQEVNLVVPLIFLFTFFGLFMLFNVFFSFAAILLITEAAMLTLIFLLMVSVVSYFPNLSADILNLLNASAMGQLQELQSFLYIKNHEKIDTQIHQSVF